MDKVKILLINPELRHVSERFISGTQESFAQAMGQDSFHGETTNWTEMTNALPGDNMAHFCDDGGEGTFKFKTGLSTRSGSVSGVVGVFGGFSDEQDEDGDNKLLPCDLEPKDLAQKILWGE